MEINILRELLVRSHMNEEYLRTEVEMLRAKNEELKKDYERMEHCYQILRRGIERAIKFGEDDQTEIENPEEKTAEERQEEGRKETVNNENEEEKKE